MDRKLQGVEYKLITRSLALSDDKYFVEAYNVYFNLIWLNGEVGTGAGDVHGGADLGPTDTAMTMLQAVEKDMSAAEVGYRELMDKDVPAFNRWLAERKLTPIAAGTK